jgi:endonuclease YncB( thermonuclease family)
MKKGMEKTSPSFKQALRIVIKRNIVRLSLLFILLAVWWAVLIFRGEQRFSITPHTLAKVALSRIDSPTRIIFFLNDPKDKKIVPTLMVALSSSGFSSAISQQCETKLSGLLEGQAVWVRSAYIDNEQQTVGRVLLARSNAQPDDVGLSLLREGCAFYCRKDASYLSLADQQEYSAAEEHARVARQGVWMDASAKAPAECETTPSK